MSGTDRSSEVWCDTDIVEGSVGRCEVRFGNVRYGIVRILSKVWLCDVRVWWCRVE